MLTSKQRAQLRSLGNSLDAIFQIGKGGVNEQLIRQVDEILEKRELIKLTTLENCPETSKDAAEKIAAATNSQVVQVIGRKFILYRQSRDNKTIKLVK
jgi:RNA-binding protein